MQLSLLALLMAGVLIARPNDCAPDSDAWTALLTWRQNSSKISMREQRESLDDLAARYPADVDIQAQRIKFYSVYVPESWPSVRASYVERSERNPGDPLAQTVAAIALQGTDTPRAIQLLTKVREDSPGFGRAALRLAETYQA